MSDLRVVLEEMHYEEDGWDAAFNMLEAAFLIYCDWGVYELSNYFHDVKFKAAPNLSYETLSERGQALYDMLDQEMGYQHYETITAYELWKCDGVLGGKVALYGRDQLSVKFVGRGLHSELIWLFFETGIQPVDVEPDTQLLLCKK